jgi:hypothetical protein
MVGDVDFPLPFVYVSPSTVDVVEALSPELVLNKMPVIFAAFGK